MTHGTRQPRPLGRILVQREVITEQQLEHALAEQRCTGARLGDILAHRGWASALSIATALARQRSIEGRTLSSRPAEARGDAWKPLGVLLVEKGLISEIQLQQALADQWKLRGFLGESLVARGWIAEATLVYVLAEQLGVELDGDAGGHASADDGIRFEVREQDAGSWRTLHVGASFLEATDFAFEEVLTDRDPQALEILRVDSSERQVVWTLPHAGEAERKLLEVFGYPVSHWNAAPWLSR